MNHRVHPIVARQFPRLASRLSPPGKVRESTHPPRRPPSEVPTRVRTRPDVASADPSLPPQFPRTRPPAQRVAPLTTMGLVVWGQELLQSGA